MTSYMNLLGLLLCLVMTPLSTGQTIHYIWPRVGSLTGGTKVTVYGSGFSTDAYNSVNLIYIGNIPCSVISYTVSANVLECVTEPYPGGVEGKTYSALQSTLITRGQHYISTGSNDAFTYHWSYTPQLWKVEPNSGPVGTVVEIGGYRLTWNYNSYGQIYIGDQVCDLRDSDNAQYGIRSLWGLIYVKCLTTEVRAGGWNGSTTISGASGKTWNHSRALYPMFDWTLGMYELFPDIHSVYPQVGSPSGGSLLTILGSGFAGEEGEIEVDIDGIPCQVVSHTSTMIQCWTGSPPPDSPVIADSNREYARVEAGYRFKGSRGVRVNQYRSIRGGSISNLHSSNKYPDQPDAVYSLPSFSTGSDMTRHNNYGERLMAFFNPHSTGRHTFYVSNDDGAQLWLGDGRNLTAAYQNSLLESPRATGFENYERWPHQKSESISLTHAQDYLLVGEFKEGGGGEYLTVGALLHDDTSYDYSQTRQAVREQQEITLTSAGLYDTQTLTLAINRSAVVEDALPRLVLEWGGRSTEPISLVELEENPEALGDAVLSLFSGKCEFDLLHGINYYPGPLGFDFEEGVNSGEAWSSWNGIPPLITEDEALCGRHSLYVEDHRGVAFNLANDNGKKTSDFPFICLGYKLPPGHSMALAVRVKDYGWYSIPLSGEDTGPFLFPIAGSFFDELYNDDLLMDDDNWHYSCTDLQFMLIENLPLEEDQNPPRFHDILGMAVYTTPLPRQRGFYVDEVALASERKSLFTDSYVAPARPNGRSLHSVQTTVTDDSDDDTLSLTISMELVPSACVDDLTLIDATLQDGTGVLQFSFERTQFASSPLGGSYTLSYDGKTTPALQHDATEEEIKAALESLDAVGEVTVTYSATPLSHDLLGSFCPGHSYTVLFETTRGDLPLLSVNEGGITGDDATTSVTEIKTGGLFLRPIPGHMLQTVETTPQVHVRVRSQLAACSGNHLLYEEVSTEDHSDYCSFIYAPSSTPIITMITPTSAQQGDVITITGIGFSENPQENFVLFDNIKCPVTTSTSTTISCVLGEGYGGTKQLYLHVTSVGVADSNSHGILYNIAAISVDTASGSQAGGTMIVISGSGYFTDNFESSSAESFNEEYAKNLQSSRNACQLGNIVTIGDNACEVISSTPETVTCITPEETGSSSTYDIIVSVGCLDDPTTHMSNTLLNAFTYDVSITPSVTAVNPSEGVVHGGETVVISGIGLADDISTVRVMIGNEDCTVTMASSTEVTCLTPAHAKGVWPVEMLVEGVGKAVGDVTFTYTLDVTSVSHCSGSLFGGQVLSIQGSRFGTDSNQVAVSLGNKECDVTTVTDNEILCVTAPTTLTYEINNNAEHPEYGLGYQWNPSTLTIHPGDTVNWSWTGSSFTARRGVAQVNRCGDTEYNGVGFRSERSVTGSFRKTFTKAGAYYYIAEGYGHIGFNGTIVVAEPEDMAVSLSLTINSILIDLSSFPPTCQQTSSPFTDYTYSSISTPSIVSVFPSKASPGDSIELSISGLSDMADDNILVFGGNTPIACTSHNPATVSTSYSTPTTSSTSTGVTYMDTASVVQCTLPDDILPGNYRTVLHVAGRGWGNAVLDDTTIEITPRIDSSPQILSISLRGGVPIILQTSGLVPSSITNTRVLIGNTPCIVQSISNSGELTCLTQAAVDDGYSSVINQNSPLGYWTLQADLPRGETDGGWSFRNWGSVGSLADATLVGEVQTRREGISGNVVTNQAASFESSHLVVPALQEFSRHSGFAAEFWLMSEQGTENYRIIVKSFSYEDSVARGYVVLINRCNQVEFWIATGETSAQNSGDFSGSAGSAGSAFVPECEVIDDASDCSSTCTGLLTIADSSDLPQGVWHVIRSEQSDWTTWAHVYFGWTVENDQRELYDIWSEEDCTIYNLCSGMQTLSVNGYSTTVITNFLRATDTPIEIGGSGVIDMGIIPLSGHLSSFEGELDEIAFYSRPISQADIDARVHFGTSEEQPIWITVEGVDGIGNGAVPNVKYPEFRMEFASEMQLDWDIVRNGDYVLDSSTALRFEWTGLRGVREVSRSIYESCDLEASYVQQWTSPISGGRRSVWLSSGQNHYFIDSVVGGCLEGRKLRARVGEVRTIQWRVGSYSDITVPRGTGLLFQWNGAVIHDLVEMKTAIQSAEDCSLGVADARNDIGLVSREWVNEPSTSGEVTISDLSLGPHHFMCSVGRHCALGMRFTVNVVPEEIHDDDIDSQNPVVHTIPWRIQDYADFTMVEGESLSFVWHGFHSLHQVTETVFESCVLSDHPLHVWGLPSVDNSVSIQGLIPGDYYYLCAVAGHCDAGMKIKVTVLPNDGLQVLNNGVSSVCADGVSCSLAYSVQATPQLASVEPSESVGGTTLTLIGANLLPPSTIVGSSLPELKVWIDNAPCTNVLAESADTATDHMISCSITDYESDYYHVDVFVSDRGFASVSPTQLVPHSIRDFEIPANFNSPYPKLFIAAVASTINPTSGSIHGGTVITISGSGFSYISERNVVSLGGVSCRIIEASSSTITCMSGPGSSSVAVTGTVNGFPISTRLLYEYNDASTPIVTSVESSPDSINSLSGGNEITLVGMMLGTALDLQVQIMNSMAGLVDFSTEDACSVTNFIVDGSDTVNVSCTAPSKPAGIYKLLVHVQGYGFATVSDNTVGYALEIDSFSPASGGHGGGVALTIVGSGFPEASNSDQISVTLCDGEPASTLCLVTSSTLNELECTLDPTSTSSPFTTNATCSITITSGGHTEISSDQFQFIGSLTPRIDSISPLIGGTGGGTTVTVEGAGFTSQNLEPITVTIDRAECIITQSTDTLITCVTGNHTTTLQAEVIVNVPGKGNALSMDGVIMYEYVDLWSSPFTWGGGPLPGEGDSVYIKVGHTVFLDVNTPVLNLLLIEGSLIFEDDQDLHLQANYIFINTGKLQVGTESSPFTHIAVITLHGSVQDPEIPIYGAKVLGIRQGELDLHGLPRAVTWTRLSQSALSNDTSLRLEQAVDWVTGDKIVIAPTGKDGNETEENEVVSVSGDGRTVNLLHPLRYTHHGVTEMYEGGHFIDIRAEVGLLSHNVIVQGSRPPPSVDQDAVDPQYGSQIFVHRTGTHPTPVRIEHIEIRYGGQAFRLGRYAVHFHLSGSMAGSYIRNCAIHHSNNRAVTAHGVHDLLIEGNVAYDIKGHTFFIEDGIETNNSYLGNLGVLTRGSSSLLNTDQIPATFWITNPQNTFIGNAAAASRAYGFWFDFDSSPSGASRTNRVCPNKEPFGVFHNNTAHTCNEFGLRIWETYVPYADGCGATQPQVATLTDFTTYANGINGVELSIVGHVRLEGFKVADNVENGIVIIETRGHWGGPKIKDALIISHTSVNSGPPQVGGIKTPNTPRLTVSNVTFANFDLPTTSCLRACSHCKVRQGGFQVWFEGLSFVGGSANHKTAFQWEWEVLFKDLDGTLTDLPGGGWVLPNSPLNPPQFCTPSLPEFSVDMSTINGTVCSGDINFLRMAWNRAEPLATLRGVSVNASNQFGSSIIPWRHYRLTHLDGYMFTMPDGYDHTLVWETPLEHRVDHTSYKAGVYGIIPNSRLWVTHQFIQTPDHVNVGDNLEPTPHGELPLDSDPLFSWHLENETDPNAVTYLITGQNLTDQNNDITFNYLYEPCPVMGCPPPAIDYGPYETFQRVWSNPEHWPSGIVPQEGEDVIISSRWRMLLDVTPPTLRRVYILGELIFEDARDYNFTADLILIQGEMARVFIGTEEQPFTHRVVITLNGLRNDVPLRLSRRLQFGSKGIGVFGNFTIHGVSKTTWTRLSANAPAGSGTLQLQGNAYPNWGVGDEIVLAPSSWEPTESEIRTISSYDRSTGTVTLSEPLEYDHLLQPFLEQSDINAADPPLVATPWWGDGGMMAPEVGLLSHNIVIQGGEDPSEPLEQNHYGCRILVGEYFSGRFVYNGRLKIDSVEIRNCGQGGYFSPRDPRYSIAFANSFETSAGSYIRRCSIHHGYNTAIGVHSSYGIEISQNVIWRTVDSGIKVGGRDNVIIDNLAMFTSTIQPNSPPDNHSVDFPATFDVDGSNIVRGNAAAGSTRIAFRYAGEPCLEDNTAPTYEQAMFWDNTAHSGLMGLVVLGLPRDCTAIGGFTATLQWNYGVFSSTASSLVATHVKIGVGKVGVNLNVFGPNPVAHLRGNKFISISDSLLVGSLPGETCVMRAPSFIPPSVSFHPGNLQMGVMMSSLNQKRSKMDGTGPWHLMKGYPVIDGVVHMDRVSFARFTDLNCDYNTVAIANNPLSADAVHPIYMTGTNKLNVDMNNLAFFYEPDPEWIVQEDCVDMDCDGPKHALIRDNDGRFVGTYPTLGSIIPFAELRFANYSHRVPVTWLAQEGENGALALPTDVVQHRGIARGDTGNLDSNAGGCEWVESWQGYRCKSMAHHMLVIESLDEDTETRRLSPLALNGGNTGAGHYTDLINGPMDHGWCVYYTCLKRLSTFFTIVAVGTDYCVWMTGSPPTQLRFHLLNAGPDDSIRMCIFFKDTRRKDVYKNNIFIEPENVEYLEEGGVLQTDGSHKPNRDEFGGANYFERESQILYMIVRGSDPVEIRTPPVVQVSLSLAVSLDDFFNVGELIRNLAFVLKIDPNKIRVVKIVSESSGAPRSRRSLLAVNEFNQTTITLEFGNPPAANITTTPPPTIAMEIMMAGEMNDSVDLDDHTTEDTPLDGTNPFNDDPPDSVESFADSFNISVVDYVEEVELYEEVLEEVMEINEIAGRVVDLVLTGGIVNVTNATVTGLSVVPATPPPSPIPPVIPPVYENATTDEGDPVIIPVEEIIESPTVATGSGENSTDTTVTIDFVIPTEMRVTLEPREVTSHLVHVTVTVFDDQGRPVENLGLANVNPWTCQATLLHPLGDKASDVPLLGGVTRVQFVRGVAEFTRLRVDRPGQGLTLSFQTVPSRFQATTSVSFQIIDPFQNTSREKIGFTLEGDTSALPRGEELNVAVLNGLSLAMDVDISRIENITVEITSAGVLVTFDLLNRQPTDPPDVLNLNDAIATLMKSMDASTFEVIIANTPFIGLSGSFAYVTPPPPISPTSIIDRYINVFIAVGVALGMFLLLTVSVMVLLLCMRGRKDGKGGNKKKGDEGRIPLYPVNRKVTPLPPQPADNKDKRDSGKDLNFFLRRPGQPLANEGSSPSFVSEEDWTGGVTDETSLGPSEVSGRRRAVDCWETPNHLSPGPLRFAPPPQRQGGHVSIAGLVHNPAYHRSGVEWPVTPSKQPAETTHIFVRPADQRRQSHARPMALDWD